MAHRRLPWVLACLAVACGSRTTLLVAESLDGAVPDGGPDARPDGRPDASPDVTDALPPIDSTKPDVPPPNDCPDADSTVVYLMSDSNDLLSFFPPTLSFKTVGKINCPNTMGGTPFSMGVDRKGAAYVVFTNGRLYKVSTLTAACSLTSFTPTPMAGFTTFGMGFAGDTMSESLYVAGSPNMGPSAGLGTIDTMTYKFSYVGPFKPPLDRTELTGTGDGRLFGWSPNTTGSGSRLVQIDRGSAQILGANNLKIGMPGDAFAFAFWGGVFWIFTGTSAPSTVTKYDPGTQQESTATTVSVLVVGAGVSTCAPSQ